MFQIISVSNISEKIFLYHKIQNTSQKEMIKDIKNIFSESNAEYYIKRINNCSGIDMYFNVLMNSSNRDYYLENRWDEDDPLRIDLFFLQIQNSISNQYFYLIPEILPTCLKNLTLSYVSTNPVEYFDNLNLEDKEWLVEMYN